MNEILNTLKPEKLWFYFGKVLEIPRASKHEEKINEYLKQFAAERKLECLQDAAGNVLIRKPATPGYENRKIVVLQCHTDMVCEKNAESTHDFSKDSIEVHIEDGWLKAKDTTLGADNGMGVAAALAILDDNTLEHGALEALFTVDEETGLTGANGLQTNWLKGEILLNLDSEDDGQFFIGCAGGKNTLIEWDYQTETTPSNYTFFDIWVKGLKGGHSGDDINRGLGNAIKNVNRLVFEAFKRFDCQLAVLQGGNLHNAIPREANAILGVKSGQENDFKKFIEEFTTIFKAELKSTEPNLTVVCTPCSAPASVITKNQAQMFVNAVYTCPHGVYRMSDDIANFVETSTNFAAVKMDGKKVNILTSQRSSIESRKDDLANMVAACFQLIGAKVQHTDGYPGWNPNPNSPIAKIICDSFRKLFKEEPITLAIHAGLECGLIGEKYPNMDMISYGPTMRGVHSPDERLKIDTVERFWDLTAEVLKNIPLK